MVEPIFKIGAVPNLPHVIIQIREYRGGTWMYAVRNNYNPWASGWATEDEIIKEIQKETKIKQNEIERLKENAI